MLLFGSTGIVLSYLKVSLLKVKVWDIDTLQVQLTRKCHLNLLMRV